MHTQERGLVKQQRKMGNKEADRMSSNAHMTLLTMRRHSKWGGVASLIPCIPAEKVGLKAGLEQASLGQGGQSSNRQVISNPQS